MSNNVNITAKNLVYKATKYSRSKRKQKSNFDSDFIYEPPSKKQRVNRRVIEENSLALFPVKIKEEEIEEISSTVVQLEESTLKPADFNKICPYKEDGFGVEVKNEDEDVDIGDNMDEKLPENGKKNGLTIL